MSELLPIISVIGGVFGIIFGIAGYLAGVRKEGNRSGTLLSDIEYIKRRSDETLIEQKETNRGLNQLSERVTRVEESAKQAHKRIDEML